MAAHTHQELHSIDWENTFVLNYYDDFFPEERQRNTVWQKNNFNQGSGLVVSPIWLSPL